MRGRSARLHLANPPLLSFDSLGSAKNRFCSGDQEDFFQKTCEGHLRVKLCLKS